MTELTRRTTMLGAAFSGLLATAARAADWPERPVRIVVPYPPGAFNDALGRLIADKLALALGQAVVVDNRPGAAGALGLSQVARATPDGYTIAVGNTPNLTVNPFILANPGYDTLKDFAPVANCAQQMAVMLVPASSPIRTLPELIAAAKARPGQLSYGTAGSGSSNHLGVELLGVRAGISALHVPYRGGNQHQLDLIAGRLDFMIDILSNVLPSIQAGSLRALAVTGNERDPSLPDAPTFKEVGIPDYEMYVWFGFVAPAHVPEPILDRIANEILTIVRSPAGTQQLLRSGARPYPQGRAEMAATIRQDLDKWGSVIRAAGIRAE
jgi:tripartite-type tricarboxylate transporter receptor subunit TctC